MKLLGIEFAPLNVPMKRRLETGAAFLWICMPVIIPIINWYFFIYVMLFSEYFYLPLLYLVYFYYDFDAPHLGGKIVEPLRKLPIWKHLNDYFPLTVVKTCDIPPDRNYIFCFYPHGILSANALVHFSTNGSNFHELYPGLRTFVATLDLHFRTPVMRDFLLAMGFISASKRSLTNVVSGKGNGKAVALIVGGAQEALYAKPGSHKIVLKNRKGFIKIALSTGASIVPVYAFGETDIYDQVPNPPGSLLYKFQEFTKKMTGMAPVLFIGRGMFQYSIGIVPRRRPIHTVFGEPINLPVEREPSAASIEKYHTLFTEKITALFEEHKHKYVEDPENAHLTLE